MARKSFYLLSLVLILLALSACAPARSLSQEGTTGLVEPASPPRQSVANAPEAAGDSFAFPAQPSEPVERIVIKNANLSIVVTDPDKSMETIGNMAEDMGGFIVSANLYQARLEGGQQVPQATITIRVPADRLDETLSNIETLSELPVENKTVQSQDVTSDYTDLQSRLRNLEAAESQLTKIMEEAYKTEDVLSVFEQLKQVREQIEVTKGQIQYYDQSARLSSINVDIKAKAAIEPLTIGQWQPKGIARDAIQALINAMQFLVDVAIWVVLLVIPVSLVVLTPPFLIVLFILRWRKKRKARAEVSAA
jgi:hypothetical protein